MKGDAKIKLYVESVHELASLKFNAAEPTDAMRPVYQGREQAFREVLDFINAKDPSP